MTKSSIKKVYFHILMKNNIHVWLCSKNFSRILVFNKSRYINRIAFKCFIAALLSDISSKVNANFIFIHTKVLKRNNELESYLYMILLNQKKRPKKVLFMMLFRLYKMLWKSATMKFTLCIVSPEKNVTILSKQ